MSAKIVTNPVSDKVKSFKISEFSQKMIHSFILQFEATALVWSKAPYLAIFGKTVNALNMTPQLLTINLKFFKIFNSLNVPDDHICHLLTGFPQNKSQVQNSVNANFSNLNSTNQISSDSPNNLHNEK